MFIRIVNQDRSADTIAMITEFGPSLYVAEGPTVFFYGFPYPTRMAVVRLSDGGAWVWSPVALTGELVDFMSEGVALEKAFVRDCLPDDAVGMTQQEIARELGISVNTVARDWKAAKSWRTRPAAGPSPRAPSFPPRAYAVFAAVP